MSNTETHLIPRWGGEPSSDWYPAAKDEGVFHRFIDMPNPSLPMVEAWTTRVSNHLETASPPAENLRLVTHSIACHSVIGALQSLPKDRVLDEVVMVAAWWHIDRDFWESLDFDWNWLLPWMEYPKDLAAVRARIRRWRVILGTGDALCPDYQTNAKMWLEAGVDSVTVLNGRGHFNGVEEEELFEGLVG